ncbi:MAG: hypothetical protein HY898_29270 [Deltaproteobacteria bacterium]|nr:hypothetical protein [Deltaproteobacteria bacterium]
MTPGLIDPTTGESAAGNYFYEPKYNPYERTATYQLEKGVRLNPGVLHTLVIYPPADEKDITGIRAFDGAPLEKKKTVSFMTSETVTDPSHDVDDVWPVVDWCNETVGPPKLPAVRTVIGKCVGCHGGTNPMGRMDLSSPDAIRTSSIGVLAAEVVPLDHVGNTSQTPMIFGQGMPRIDPGNPGNSYLLYKLIINELNYPSPGDPAASDPFWERGLPPLEPPSNEEIQRLRDSFVWMDPMPVGGRLLADDMRALVVWIAQGAHMAQCVP